MKVKLLDCTLRDGGFINDWEFGYDTIISIFERLVSSKIDIIEVGFLDDRRQFDINRTIMPDTNSVNKIFGDLSKKNSMIVGMIDYGTCSIDNIDLCKDSYLDGIRVIFKKEHMKEAIQFCSKVNDKGFAVFVQPVSITSYSDEEMLQLIKLINELKPYSMSIVDTYGLLHKNNLIHYYHLFNDNLNVEINIGYHSHNNFQLGYANSIELMEIPTNRSLFIDGSVYGMGKGAGNANIELLAMYMNDNFNAQYDINQILEIIDVNIMNIFKKSPWGYSLNYYLAASNDCHPSYVQHLVDKRTLSVKSVNEILASIKYEKKLKYDNRYIEDLYREYHIRTIDDSHAVNNLKEIWKGREILLLGPGASIIHSNDIVQRYVDSNFPIVIAINFVPNNINIDFLFLSNSKRYVQLANRLKSPLNDIKIVATSNLTNTSGKFDYVLDYSRWIDTKANIIDNPLLMILKILANIEIKNVTLAGFDGYGVDRTSNYYNPHMEYIFSKDQALALNDYVKKEIEVINKNIKIKFITKSYYTE